MTTYHPRFTSGGDVVLQSSDSVSFRYDFRTLVLSSEFFASLATLPTPTPPPDGDASESSSSSSADSAEATTIPLPDTGTPALAAVLDVLAGDSVRAGELVGASSGAGKAVGEILYCVDAFELPRSIIAEVYAALLGREAACPPSVLFALSVVSGLGNTQYWSTKVVGAGARALDPWARNVLRARHPDILRSLHSLFRRFERAFADFHKATATMCVDNNFAFGRRCREPPCPTASQFDADFGQFHADARARITQFARAHPQLMQSQRRLTAFCDFIQCPVCRTRIVQAAKSAFAKHMPRSVWCLENLRSHSRPAAS